MALSDYDQLNVGAILGGAGDWFTAKLMRLISVADTLNRFKLYRIYPEEVNCVHAYQFGVPFRALYTERKNDEEPSSTVIDGRHSNQNLE